MQAIAPCSVYSLQAGNLPDLIPNALGTRTSSPNPLVSIPFCPIASIKPAIRCSPNEPPLIDIPMPVCRPHWEDGRHMRESDGALASNKAAARRGSLTVLIPRRECPSKTASVRGI